MQRQTSTYRTGLALMAMALYVLTGVAFASSPQQPSKQHTSAGVIRIHPSRLASSDLAITGMVAGLPAASTGYVRYTELMALPQVAITIHHDENFPQLSHISKVDVEGIYLDQRASALGVQSDADLISATCVDQYQAHYPSSYISAHRPVLVLSIHHLPSDAWSKRAHQQSPGPYFITQENFKPAFKAPSDLDRPQEHSKVLRLDFSTTAKTFGAIHVKGSFASTSPEELGFAIASRIAYVVHNQDVYGGDKSGRTWFVLSTWAQEQPAYFASYIRKPQAMDSYAQMPAYTKYDDATLAVITAYFKTLLEPLTSLAPNTSP